MKPEITFQKKIEHLFRREYVKICASLSHRFGIQNIQIVEDSVQDALIKAMQVWGYTDIPDNPSAWLYKVASNRALDILRRENKSNTFPEYLNDSLVEEPFSEDIDQVNDDLLKMIFTTCHPVLSTQEQIMLSLKLLCGFSIDEISRALVKQNEAVKKSLTRAKGKFRSISKGFELPQDGEEQKERLEVVLKVLYLMFTEGYKATSGQNLIKSDVCEEAIRLTYILSNHSRYNSPQVFALLALMCFNYARFSSRQDPQMHLVTLKDQDRNNWDKNYINMGVCYLSMSAKGSDLSKYHLESGIASLYIMPEKYSETNWPEILRLYDLLVEIDPSLSAKLNRIVVLSKVKNCKIALNELNLLHKNYPKIETHLFFAIRAELEQSCALIEHAIKSLYKAIELAQNEIEKRFLEAKLKTVLN
ncbi:MAG: sigma-70 family RNA polymerase sigma factor [Calditrichaeota bacterium]|nr:MAG: hypothetical protein DWQ03_06600 [Calditrichota bacterium]MBL1203846.1 sigma-70 family RNA polymerase sigma factor [Calditrichota bacterium]NOG43678.1 sigma-70 family RNA polymerase sigma factor [Calditrichota bacterium]